ncbi:calcium-binding protein [Teichococcus aestuarii]|uniref:calcium-binding protein n=1 Tax=Teichococcus aestuarii TaxID=568898 RepID=UPI001FE278B2|nr:calcium-binding protein [Pseudoroseomonas aestuarii]
MSQNQHLSCFLTNLTDRVADTLHGALGGLHFDFEASGHVHNITFGGENKDTLGGSEGAEFTWGLEGDDRIGGGGMEDILHGGPGADLVSGNMGDDEVEGGDGNDTLYGGPGADTLRGGAGDDYLDEGEGHSTVDGGMGDDTLVGGGGPDAFMIGRMSGHDVIKDFTAGPGMFDHLAVMDGLQWTDLSVADTAEGVKVSWERGSVLLEGVAKSDLAQDDFMFADAPDLPPGLRDPAGPNDEARTASEAGPEISGEVQAGTVFDQLVDHVFNDRTLRFDIDEDAVVRGTAGADTLSGSEKNDTVFGLAGDDNISGMAGDDHLQGDDGRDTMAGGDGMDRLMGEAGDDRLSGGAESDELMGGDGDDYLDEGAAHGMLNGGMGDDTLVGGTGADAFMVSMNSGHDVVQDFEATGDAQGAFDHIAFMDIQAEDVEVRDTAEGALIGWGMGEDGGFEGSILLEGVAKGDLRQTDFMFGDRPQYVEGIGDFGSWYIFPESSGAIA